VHSHGIIGSRTGSRPLENGYQADLKTGRRNVACYVQSAQVKCTDGQNKHFVLKLHVHLATFKYGSVFCQQIPKLSALSFRGGEMASYFMRGVGLFAKFCRCVKILANSKPEEATTILGPT
jgi:hypothetical protein